jgi:hypothetical protein
MLLDCSSLLSRHLDDILIYFSWSQNIWQKFCEELMGRRSGMLYNAAHPDRQRATVLAGRRKVGGLAQRLACHEYHRDHNVADHSTLNIIAPVSAVFEDQFA